MIEVGEFREGMPLSELIQLAVNDARKAEATGKYVLDGGYWHEPVPSRGVCKICLGGGVIAGLVAFDAGTAANERAVGSDELEQWETNLLVALDNVRMGLVEFALNQLGKDWEPHEAVVESVSKLVHDAYAASGEKRIAPLETYEAAAQILAEVGL